MASTYTPNDAITFAQNMVHGTPVSNISAAACDMANSFMWTFYPWGWSIASITATSLNQQTQGAGSPPTGGALFTGNQQDYTITGAWISYPISLNVSGTANNNYGGGWPLALATASTPGLTESGFSVTATTIYPHNLPSTATGTCTINGATVAGYNTTLTITSIPNNTTIIGTIGTSGLANSGGSGDPGILRPVKMRICRLDSDPPEYRELQLMNSLGPEFSRTAGIDTMKGVGWFSSTNFFRFDVAPQVANGQLIQLQGEYQQKPTRITNSNLSTPFSFPDVYFETFMEGVLWKLYQLTDDPRAGGIQVNRNGTQMQIFTGQFGVFYQCLQLMARTEDLGAGDAFQFPEQPLGTGRSYWPGLYGV